MKVNERFLWACSVVDPRPNEHMLEIGCGAGLLLEQVANRLNKGSITAVDRSAAMIKLAARRNAEAISKGTVKLLNTDFTRVVLTENQFDKIIGFNVGFFLNEASTELSLIKRLLKREGSLFVFYQPPSDEQIKDCTRIETGLAKNSFQIIDTIVKKMRPASVYCVEARPTHK